jgi:hypothetical protein
MLAIAVELVVQSLQVGFDRKLRIKREDVADMSSGGDHIAQHCRGRSKEGMVDLVGTTYYLVQNIAYTLCTKKRTD